LPALRSCGVAWRGVRGRIEGARKAIRRLLTARDIGRNITEHDLELRFLPFLDAQRLPARGSTLHLAPAGALRSLLDAAPAPDH